MIGQPYACLMKFSTLIVSGILLGGVVQAATFPVRCKRDGQPVRRIELTYTGIQDAGNAAPVLTAEFVRGRIKGLATHVEISNPDGIRKEIFTIPGNAPNTIELRVIRFPWSTVPTVTYFDGVDDDYRCAWNDPLPVLKE